MNLRSSRRRQEDPEITLNLTSLIDVMFLLLIFFMVTSTFTQQSVLHVDLPRVTQQAHPGEENSIDVTIDAQGTYYLNGRQLTNARTETLKRVLRQAMASHRDPSLIITADAKTPHQAVVTVMDAARQVGLLHLSIATQATESKP